MQVSHSRQQPLSYICQFAKVTLFMFVMLLCSAKVLAVSGPSITGITIENFGQVDERLYRGGQPKPEDYRALAALGIKTVIDLRNDPETYESDAVTAAGLHYVHIPMSAKHPPTDAQVVEFLKTIDDQANGKLYVHCAGGRHRTGVMVAVYRFARYHWSSQQAYDEMKAYDFYTRWGHGAMKDYVFNFKEIPGTDVSASLNAANNVDENAQQH